MKEQYDFSKGERGKFYRKNAKLNLPIYLDDDVLQFVEGVAKKKKMDIQTVVNRLLKNDIKVAELLQ
jgi:Holliday junction resolvasome RuvABC endonuclease subunit